MCDSRNGKRKVNTSLIVWASISVAGLIVVISILVLEHQKGSPDILLLWQNFIISVLCSIIASGIFYSLQRAFLRKDDELLQQDIIEIDKKLKTQSKLYNSGVLSIHPKSHFDNEEVYWEGIISKAHTRLDLIGHSISKWFRSEYKEIFLKKIKEITDSGWDVNIILSTDNFDASLKAIHAAYVDQTLQANLSKLERTILEFYTFYNNEMGKESRKHLRICVTDLRKVTYLYIRTDAQCIISPYMHSLDDHQNSFLLELQPGTQYVKSLEDDFQEMFERINPIDLSERNYEMIQIDSVKTKNLYSGSNWNQENTEKLIYKDNSCKYEVGYFEHYLDGEFVKSVIELPVSYGCPAKCKYCASSKIVASNPLSDMQMLKLFEDVYKLKSLETKDIVLLSLTGIGDLFFNTENVLKFLKLLEKYNNIQVTLSSSFWNTRLLSDVVELKDYIHIRCIQYTYVSCDSQINEKLIPFYKSFDSESQLDNFLEFTRAHSEFRFRINYIVIKDINDSKKCIDNFINKIEGTNLIVRISKLNETNATKSNQLKSVPNNKLNEIRDYMRSKNLNCYAFYSHKNDNMNCGQLITERDFAQ